MEVDSDNARASTEEEADVLCRSRWRKIGDSDGKGGSESEGERRFTSYKDSVIGDKRRSEANLGDTGNDGYVSDDDVVEVADDETWFGVGMTRKEKIKARRPWRNNLIIKLVGRSIGYHYLYRRIQAMWRTQDDPLLIDLGFDYFIVKLGRQEEYDRALLEGP